MFGKNLVVTTSGGISHDEEEKHQLVEIKHALEQERAERAELESRLNKLEKLLVSLHPNQSISQETSDADGTDLFVDNLHTEVSLSQTIEGFEEEKGNETLPLCNGEEVKMKLTEDIFSLMMISPLCSWGYFLGIITCAFQVVLAFDYIFTFLDFIMYGQDERTEYGFDIPVNVSKQVRFGQYCVALLSIWLQSDILTSIQFFFAFRRGTKNIEILKQNQIPSTLQKRNSGLGQHSNILFRAVYFPNFLRLLQGIVVIFLLMILIITNNDFIELLKDFTALFIISQIDDVVFQLLRRGYFFGFHMAKNAEIIEKIEFVEERTSENRCFQTSYFVRSLILGSMNIGMIIFVSIVAKLQTSGYFLNVTFPACDVPNKSLVGNGKCHEYEPYNTEECGWDGGDCFLEEYPDCHGVDITRIGNRFCDNYGKYNTKECGWDGGDCLYFNNNFPNCTAGYPYDMGDGNCIEEYNKEECGWDGGDCNTVNEILWEQFPNCTNGVYPLWIGNGQCDGRAYNTEECGWDGGDCTEFNSNYPDCKVDYPSRIGDGTCHNWEPYNTEECGWDGGDCFIAEYPDCHFVHPEYIGDNACVQSLNTEECGWDGGDCIEFNTNYPNCTVSFPQYIGDGQCRSGEYNTEECGWDGGDCLLPSKKAATGIGIGIGIGVTLGIAALAVFLYFFNKKKKSEN